MVYGSDLAVALAAALAMAVSALTAPPNTSDQEDRVAVRGPNPASARAHDSAQASTRLMKELVETLKCDSHKRGVFQVELVNDDLYGWEVKLFFPDPGNKLHEDLSQLEERDKQDHVLLRITFGRNYPNELPFVRIIYPILKGCPTGALCMYLLSPQGWIPDCTVEALILTVIDQINAYKYGVDFNKCQSKYPEEESERHRWSYSQMHGWNKPRPEGMAWYKGPDTE